MATPTHTHREPVRFAMTLALAALFLAAPIGASGSASPVLTLTPGMASTAAGTGASGYSGDGGPATSAQFNSPMGVTRDAQGNMYIADFVNNVVRKVATDGTVTTVAGNGTQGYSGDGGQATSAELAFPAGVAVDNNGNLYIAEFLNSDVRKVDTNGVITTLAVGFIVRGVVADNAGNVYFSSYYEGVWKVDSTGATTRIAGNGNPGYSGDGGPALQAQTSGVAGLALDSQGNLYLAEVVNSDVRKIDTSGIITTVAGTHVAGFAGDGGPATSAQLNGPADVHFDAGGNMYIVDSSNNRIRKIDASGTISSIAGSDYGYTGDGGLASTAEFANPTGIALDSNANLFVGDTANNVIRKVQVDSATLNFGTVIVGQTGGPISMIVSNAGGANLNFSSIAASNSFGVQTTCSENTPILPGASCVLNISFTPIATGVITGTVTIADNTTANPHTINLKGQGAPKANPDFAISLSKASLTVGQTSSGTVNVTITPSNGLSGAVTLSCGSLPSHAVCSFAPSSLTADGSNAPLSSVLTVTTGSPLVALTQPVSGTLFAAGSGMFGAGLLGLVFAPLGRRAFRPRHNKATLLPLMLIAIILFGGLVGCGSIAPGKSGSGTPTGSYPITVTATAGGITHSSSFTLVVQ